MPIKVSTEYRQTSHNFRSSRQMVFPMSSFPLFRVELFTPIIKHGWKVFHCFEQSLVGKQIQVLNLLYHAVSLPNSNRSMVIVNKAPHYTPSSAKEAKICAYEISLLTRAERIKTNSNDSST